jgi:hypothetical protein
MGAGEDQIAEGLSGHQPWTRHRALGAVDNLTHAHELLNSHSQKQL